MTTLTPPQTAQARPVSFAGTVRSEWIKFRGLTSNFVLAGFTLLLLIANGVAMPWAYVFRDRGSPQADYDAYAEMIVDKTGYVEIVLVVLAALMVTNEYRSGQVKTTFLSVPRRTPVLIAKALIIATVAFVIGVVSSSIGFAVAPSILAGGGYSSPLDASNAVRLILGSGLYLAALSIIGIALGVLIRNVVASVLSVFVLLLILPVVPQMFSEHGAEVTQFFPIQAGSLLLAQEGSGAFDPWIGYLILVGWALTLSVIAAVVLRRRDA
ncbi:MAG: ABC transporter permease subunit [Microbacterium sp.]